MSRPSRDVKPLDHAPGVRLHGAMTLVFVAANLPPCRIVNGLALGLTATRVHDLAHAALSTLR